MKRATLTPNRFITFTPSWWAKGFVLFIGLIFWGSCLDETSYFGFRKDPRFQLKYKEFSIPAYTVQADSVRSQNTFVSTGSDRLLCGKVNSPIDPNFGSITSTLFTQFLSSPAKINQTGKTGFKVKKLTFSLALDYYVYGDTLDSPSTFTLHQISGAGLNPANEYHTNSNAEYDLNPISTSAYEFKTSRFRLDSLKLYPGYNADGITTNDVYDTLTFDIPFDSELASALFDSAMRKGIYSWQKTVSGDDTLAFNDFKTDSVFLTIFKGFAVVPAGGNRVLGFKSLISSLFGSSRLTLYYEYEEGGVSKIGKHYYFLQGLTGFSKVEVDRSGTNISGLPSTAIYSNFNAPDNYCYVQSGTGLYTKLDLTAVRATFDSIENVAINSAELIIPLEPASARPHVRTPGGLFLRTVKNNSRFFVPPQIQRIGADGKPLVDTQGNPVMGPDPQYGGYYYCISNEIYLDALGDDQRILNLAYRMDDDGQYYRGYLTEFFEYHTRLPETISRVNYLALVPSSSVFGKSLDGVSFKKDQVKLRVYYTQTK